MCIYFLITELCLYNYVALSQSITSSVELYVSSVELLYGSDSSNWLDLFDVSTKDMEIIISVSRITLEFMFTATLFSSWFSCNPLIVFGLGSFNATGFVLDNSSGGDSLLDGWLDVFDLFFK